MSELQQKSRGAWLWTSLLVGALGAMSACGPASSAQDEETSKLEAQKEPVERWDTIKLERTLCFGHCPAFVVTYHRDGRAELNARGNIELSGKHEARLGEGIFDRLCLAIDKIGLNGLEPHVPPTIVDVAWTIVTLEREGHKLRFKDYSDETMPAELWATSLLLDGLRLRLGWTKID
ncbi:MAG: DUF6438 domain-containing protein [Planctomycetota bacterium]